MASRRSPGEPPLFSLLLGTVGRVAEPRRLLESLEAQTCRDFEIIVVDQNEDDRLGALLDRFGAELSITRIRCARGLSRARNAGLPRCGGELIALPDDDCWYPPTLLEEVARVFREHPAAGFVTTRWQDQYGSDGFGRWPRQGERVGPHHVWTRAISFTLFFRRTAMDRIGGFDERLGVGAGTPWGSGEETDYLLRALEAGIEGWHEPACVVRHPRMLPERHAQAIARAAAYGRGIGFVLRKHRAGARRILRFLARPLAGALLAAATLRGRKAIFHLMVFEGRCAGLLAARTQIRPGSRA
jgi:glycosyltransferase involved in cell wall biosynthesis